VARTRATSAYFLGLALRPGVDRDTEAQPRIHTELTTRRASPHQRKKWGRCSNASMPSPIGSLAERNCGFRQADRSTTEATPGPVRSRVRRKLSAFVSLQPAMTARSMPYVSQSAHSPLSSWPTSTRVLGCSIALSFRLCSVTAGSTGTAGSTSASHLSRLASQTGLIAAFPTRSSTRASLPHAGHQGKSNVCDVRRRCMRRVVLCSKRTTFQCSQSEPSGDKRTGCDNPKRIWTRSNTFLALILARLRCDWDFAFSNATNHLPVEALCEEACQPRGLLA